MVISRRSFMKLCSMGAASVAVTSLVGCGDKSGGGSKGGAAVANNEKPVVFYNRQPSNSTTGDST